MELSGGKIWWTIDRRDQSKIKVWDNFLNHCSPNKSCIRTELAKYRAKILFGGGIIEFDDQEGKMEFLLTWT